MWPIRSVWGKAFVRALQGVANINGELGPAQDAPASILDSGFIGYTIPYVWHWPMEAADSGISLVIPSIRYWPASVVDAKINSVEPWTSISLLAEVPARVPQPAARLQRDHGRARDSPLVAVKA